MVATKTFAVRDQFSQTAGGRLQALLRLAFRFDETTKATLLTRSTQEPPLRVVRAFSQADGTSLVHLHNVSGGLLGGDSLSLEVDAGARASVQLTTTGATRIYRPRRESSPASQLAEIAVGENALLEYVPDAVIPFAGVRYEQRTKIRLGPGAGLFWWEILAPGREARGELFQYESVEMKLDLEADGRLVAAERVRLQPKRCALESSARLGHYRYWATFYICRVGVEPSAWRTLEQELQDEAAQLSRPAEILWGISALVSHGIVARGLAVHGRDISRGLHTIWSVAKLRLHGREAIPPRKMN